MSLLTDNEAVQRFRSMARGLQDKFGFKGELRQAIERELWNAYQHGADVLVKFPFTCDSIEASALYRAMFNSEKRTVLLRIIPTHLETRNDLGESVEGKLECYIRDVLEDTEFQP